MLGRLVQVMLALVAAVAVSTTYLPILAAILVCGGGALAVYAIRRSDADVTLATVAYLLVMMVIHAPDVATTSVRAIALSLVIAGSAAALAVVVWLVRQFLLQK